MAASPLTPVSIVAPGFYGLNTQEASVSLQQNFALIADNAVIDSYGRIGARKGYTTTSTSDAANTIYCIHEHVNKDASSTIYFAAGDKFYSMAVDGTVTTEYTDPTPASDGNWQAMSFNGDGR